MRFVECCNLTVLVTTLTASASATAQNAASVPSRSHTSSRTAGCVAANSGLEPHIASHSRGARQRDRRDRRTGVGRAGAGSNLQDPVPDLGGAAAGAVTGSVLGYTYYVNVNEQRAARCRAKPTACA